MPAEGAFCFLCIEDSIKKRKQYQTFLTRQDLSLCTMENKYFASGDRSSNRLRMEVEKEAGTMEKVRKERKGISLILRCFMLLVLTVSVGVFISKMISYAQLTRELERLENEKMAFEEQIAQLNYRINSPIDYEDIVRIAREKLNLAFPDETVFYNEQKAE
jgi:cell division protein FtsL